MQIKEKGVLIEFKLCNIPEKLELLGAIGMSPNDSQFEYDYAVLAKGIRYIEPMIKSVSVKAGNKVISSWSDLLEREDMTEHVIKVFTTILNPPKQSNSKKS